MLLEFKAKNYKSFRDELVFSMEPAPKQKGLDYSILKKMISKKEYKALSSAVVYGANASGKTNIIGAMDTFRAIILRGGIKNEDGMLVGPNAASSKLELIPNNLHDKVQPVSFAIKFIIDDLLVEYSVSMLLGRFLDMNYNRQILSEILKINRTEVFSRSEKLNISSSSLQGIQKYLVNEYAENANSAIALAGSNLDDKELFLMNGFKMMFSSKLVSVINEWFEKKFKIIIGTEFESPPKISAPNEQTAHINPTINEAVKQLGINANLIGYVKHSDEVSPVLCSVFKDKTIAIPASSFESYGTIRFVKLFPFLSNALQTGATLVIDEFDASIHPMALMSIVNVFHNDDINTHGAQLIFNTHNPIFLNANLFRRDEIKFVERDDDTHASTHYSLSDFGTTGENSARKGGDYMKNYFVDRYGAIRNVDFTPIFEHLPENEGELQYDQ